MTVTKYSSTDFYEGLRTAYGDCEEINSTFQINHQLYATISPVYFPDVYLQLNMFRVSSRPSSGAQQLQWQPPIFTFGAW
jgi:hypothetical protein